MQLAIASKKHSALVSLFHYSDSEPHSKLVKQPRSYQRFKQVTELDSIGFSFAANQSHFSKK